MSKTERQQIDSLRACKAGNALMLMMELEDTIKFSQSMHDPDGVVIELTINDQKYTIESTLEDAIGGDQRCAPEAALSMLIHTISELVRAKPKYTPVGFVCSGSYPHLKSSFLAFVNIGEAMRFMLEKLESENGSPFDFDPSEGKS